MPENSSESIEDVRPRILVRANGPYRVYGPILVVDVDGNEFELPDEVFVLCRCGHSENKPFCDGTHKTTDFTPETRAAPRAPEAPPA
jgi:CDGSH-type Zn-finger protein